MNEGTQQLSDAEKKDLVKSLVGKPVDEVMKVIGSDPALLDIAMSIRDEDLASPAAATGTPAIPSQGEGSQGSSQGPQGPQGPLPAVATEGGQQNHNSDTDDEEVTLTIKKSLLGTYGKNRKPEEAIMEMHKGITEKDSFIDFLKKNKVPVLEQELQVTKSELMSTRQKLEELLKQSTQQRNDDREADAASGEDLSLPDQIDIFDPDHQEKLTNVIKKQAELIKELRSGGIVPQPSQPQAGATGPQAQSQNGSGMNPAELEAAQIRMITKNPQYVKYFGGMQRDVIDIENDFLSFATNLAILNGHNGGILDANGRLVPTVADLVNKYHDTSNAQGDPIRARAQQSGVKPPDDMDYLTKVYNIRRIRNQYLKSGQNGPEPMSWEEAAAWFAAQNPVQQIQPPAQPQLSPEQQRHLQYQNALNNRSQFSREPATNAGPDLSDIRNLPPQEFERLQKKPWEQMNPQEKDMWKRVLRELGKMPDEEISRLYPD